MPLNKNQKENISLQPEKLKIFIIENWPGEKVCDWSEIKISPLKGDGSVRCFWRLQCKNESFVLLWGPNHLENLSYLKIAKHLKSKDLPLPKIYAYYFDRLKNDAWFLLEDLGNVHLFDKGAKSLAHYLKAASLLASFHGEGKASFDLNWCYQSKYYDKKLIMEKEVNYCLEEFVEGKCNLYLDGVRKQSLLREARSVAETALGDSNHLVLIHRDFQSKNLMLKNDKLYIIDWQGARFGPLGYDLASLIYDPYAPWALKWQDAIIEAYLKAGKYKIELTNLNHLALCRLMQALGAYAKLSINKKHFLNYIPQTLKNLALILKKLNNYSALTELIFECQEIMETN